MTCRGSAIALAAALLAGAPVRAAPAKKPAAKPAAKAATAAPATPPPSTAPAAADTATGKPLTRFGWGGIGIYGISETVTAFGFTGSASTTNFGFNAGAAINVLPITPDLPLALFGNAALAFGSDFTIIPLTAGAAVHYDKLPVALLGGLGFTVMPHTGGGSTPLGLGILLMGLLPLPQVAPNVSGEAQFQYHFLSDGFSLWTITVGAGYSF